MPSETLPAARGLNNLKDLHYGLLGQKYSIFHMPEPSDG